MPELPPNVRRAMQPTWLDRVVSWWSPRSGFDRHRYRVAMALSETVDMSCRKVGGLMSNRIRRDWTGSTESPDSAIRYDREKIRNIVRDLVLGNPYAAGALNRIVANVVGRGIKPQCRLMADTPETEPFAKPPGWRPITERQAGRFQSQAESLWAEFADVADIGGRLTFYQLQTLAEREDLEAGEVIVHLPRVPRKNRPVGFAVELIEADRLDTPVKKITDSNIRDGVEFDPKTGAPVAYWIADAHPGEDDKAQTLNGYTRIPRFDRLGRAQVLHLYDLKRAGQTRGYSPFAPSLGLFEDMDRYWEAEIMAARIAACYCAFVESPVATTLRANMGENEGDDKDKRVESFEPGMIWYGQTGEKVTFGNPNRPNAQMTGFTELLLRAIGVSLDLAYELFALDFSKTNYSSARGSLLETRRTFQYRQSRQITGLGRPVWEQVIEDGILSGRLSAPGYDARRRDYLDSFWTPPAWGWVDPVDEMKAAQGSIRSFLSTHADELASLGRDFDQTVEQIAREHATLKRLGLPSPWDALAPPDDLSPAKKPVKPPPAKKEPADAPQS